jgi:hypothetical protein
MPNPSEIETLTLTAAERDCLFAAIGHIVVNFQQVELWLAESLASVLSLQVIEDRHVISSAMSFRQKVDLVAELYPRKKTHERGVEMKLIKKALYTAEEFRNRIVHSLWTVELPGKWVQIKGSIKGKSGFSLATTAANIAQLEAAAAALLIIREWELNDAATLQAAITVIGDQNSTLGHRGTIHYDMESKNNRRPT